MRRTPIISALRRQTHRRRPGSRWLRGVAASGCAAALASGLAGCGDNPVYITTPQMSTSDAQACQALKNDLPEQLDGRHRRLTQPAAALGAAWGDDPPITLVCGVPQPSTYDKFAPCQEANGVGWFVPESQTQHESSDVTMTTVGYRPRITVTVPVGDRPEGVASAMAALAPLVKDHLELVQPCQ